MLEEGLNLATEDSEAFDAVVDSFKLPKDTEEMKIKRRECHPSRDTWCSRSPVPYSHICLTTPQTLA